MERFLMKMGMSCRKKEDGDLHLKLEADVETDLKSYPVRTVTYYQTGDGSITYKYDKLKPSPSTSDWGIWRFMVACCEILAQCCGILAQCLRDIWGWCRGR